MRPIIDHRFWILLAATCFATTQCISSNNHHTDASSSSSSSSRLHTPPAPSSPPHTTPSSEWPPAAVTRPHPNAEQKADEDRNTPDLKNMHVPPSAPTSTLLDATASLLIKTSDRLAGGIHDDQVISTSSSGTSIRHAPLPNPAASVAADERLVAANAIAGDRVTSQTAASNGHQHHQHHHHPSTTTSSFGPVSNEAKVVSGEELETRKPPSPTSAFGSQHTLEDVVATRYPADVIHAAQPLIRRRRHAHSDGLRFGHPTVQPQLGRAASELRHRHPQPQPQSVAPASDDAQLDRPITHDHDQPQVKPPSPSSNPHQQLTPSRYGTAIQPPRAQIPSPHEQQPQQPPGAEQSHPNTSNSTTYQQLLELGPATNAARVAPRDNDANISVRRPMSETSSFTVHPPSITATTTASATTTTQPPPETVVSSSVSRSAEDVVVAVDSLNDDDIDDVVNSSSDDADDADMELNAIQRGAHSNEQIIILSNGDSSARRSAEQRQRLLRHSSESVSTGGARIKPTMRRRSAAPAPAPAAGQPKATPVGARRAAQPPSAGDVLRNPLADLTLSSAASSSSEGSPTALDEPKVLPLRPIIRGPYDDEDVDGHQGEMTVVYAEPHTEIKLNCDVDLDIKSTVWLKDGQLVHTTVRNSRPTDNRFIREVRGGLTITNAMLEDDGKWQCEAEDARGYVENARPVKLVVLDRPKPPYLLIDSRRLDAGNIFVPVKENSELSLACISEGGNPKPTLTWEVLLSPGVDRHAQKAAAETLDLQEIRSEKDKDSGAVKSEAKLSAVYRAHHNARILCVMEHPTLKMRQNASILLDVQYTPSFAISRTPGFGYPLREGIEVSLKCDVDSNPPSTPMWQKDDGDPPVPQTGDGFLNFTAIRREHSGWYKCTSRHLNFQYSSIGYYLSIRYDTVDVTSEPLEQDIAVAASHTPNKRPQLEVQLGGAVTLQCPQGSLGCWSHLDPVTAKLRGLGMGLTTPTGQFSLKDVVYQDAGIYKCIGQSTINNKKKVEVIHTVAVQVKGAPTVSAKNNTPVAYPGAPLHLSVEFCANPPAFAARWLHGDRVYTPGNQYGIDVLAYGVIDLPTPFCKEARLTYVHMHERVPRTFYFIVSSPGGVAETIFNVNFTLKHKVMSNSVDDDDEELSEPEEIHFPVFGSSAPSTHPALLLPRLTALASSTFAFIAGATSSSTRVPIAKANDITHTHPPTIRAYAETAIAASSLQQLLLLVLSPVLLLMNSRVFP